MGFDVLAHMNSMTASRSHIKAYQRCNHPPSKVIIALKNFGGCKVPEASCYSHKATSARTVSEVPKTLLYEEENTVLADYKVKCFWGYSPNLITSRYFSKT